MARHTRQSQSTGVRSHPFASETLTRVKRSPHAEPHQPARDLARGQGQGGTVAEQWINGEQGGELRFEAAEEVLLGA